MRATEFLLEYKRDVTLKNFRDKMWKQMTTDTTLNNTVLEFLNKAYQDYITGEIEDDVLLRINTWIEKELAYIEYADPTSNKQYTQWVVRMYVNGVVGKIEDITSTIGEFLPMYHKLKVHKKLPPELSDVNRIKTASSFNTAYTQVNNLYDELIEKTPMPKGEVKFEKQFSDVRLLIPGNEEAACYYGQGTQWCTAATNGMNYFQNYNSEGELFILIPKQPKYDGEKYQLHFGSASYMDETDSEVSISYLLNDRFNPDLLEFMKSYTPVEEFTVAVAFADHNIIDAIAKDVTENTMEYVSEEIADWGGYDDDYYEYLRNEFPDGNSDIDWENNSIPSYQEWNHNVGAFYNDISDILVGADHVDIIQAVEELELEDAGLEDLVDIPDIMAAMLESAGEFSNVATFMRRHIYIRLQKTPDGAINGHKIEIRGNRSR